MSTKKLNLKWVITDSNEQFEWLFNHLKKKGWLPPSLNTLQKASPVKLLKELSNWNNDPESRERLNGISAAWSTVKQNKRPGQVAVKLILSTETKESLNELAKSQGITLKECITKLILTGNDLDKKYRQQQADVDERRKEEKRYDQLLINTLGRALGDVLNELAMRKVGITQDKATAQALTQSQENKIKRAYEDARKEVIARNVNQNFFASKMFSALIKRSPSNASDISLSNTSPITAPIPATQTEKTSSHALAPDSQPTASMTPPFLNAELQATEADSLKLDSTQTTEEEPSPSLMPGDNYDDESQAKAFSLQTNYVLQRKKTLKITLKNSVSAVTPKDISKPATKEGGAKEASNSPSEAPLTSTDET